MRSMEPQRTFLTPRQGDVAALLVGTGLSYKQIAARLGVREGTVRTHTEKVYRAFGVHSRAELTVTLRAP
jgi:DNA-binding NarL/FixJ family response regulator